MIRFGIEHEFVFKNKKGVYLDFTSNSYEVFKKIVDEFPVFDNDKKYFDCKSIEIIPKRCYIEGFEFFDKDGNLTYTLPKGLEIRTTPHDNIFNLIDEFTQSFYNMLVISTKYDLVPILSSFNPYLKKEEIKNICIDKYNKRTPYQLQIARCSMLTNGIHITFSINNPDILLDDIVNKLNYYLPYIIPFSFSSIFYDKKLFEGQSYRIYFISQIRNLVVIRKRKNIDTIEFRAFDTVHDITLLKALIILIKGIVLDKKLKNRRDTQDNENIKKSCIYGFSNSFIQEKAIEILNSIKYILKDDEEIDILYDIANNQNTLSNQLKYKFEKTNDIIETLSGMIKY